MKDRSPLLCQIEQATGRRDDDVQSPADLVDLGLLTDTAEDRGGLEAHVAAVGPHALADLRREFARRHEDQRSYAPRPGRPGLVDAVQQRQRESCCLAGTGLGAGEDVRAGQDERDGLLLDRRGFAVTVFLDRTQQFGSEAEFAK